MVWSKQVNGKTKEQFNGKITVPEGGWVTARVTGKTSDWPMMDSYPYAETSPIWFHKVGSTSSTKQKEAAIKLLSVLNASYTSVNDAYGTNPIPNITAHFNAAKTKLLKIIEDEQ